MTTIFIEKFCKFYVVHEIAKLEEQNLHCKLSFNIDQKLTKVYGVNI